MLVGQPASGRVLQCRDMVAEILEHLAPGWPREGSSKPEERARQRDMRFRTLASAALVSKLFSELALDVLWRVLDDIDVLLELFPSLKEHQHYGSTIRVLDEVTPEHWARFQQYARRVRALRSADSVPRVHASVWTLLESLCKGKPLLPNLRRLKMGLYVQNPAGFMLLVSPSLQNLEMTFYHGSVKSYRVAYSEQHVAPAAGILLQLILSKVPNLCTLSVEDGLEGLAPRHLKSLTLLKELQNLNLLFSGVSVDFATIHELSHGRPLRSLDLALGTGFAKNRTAAPFGDAFRNLRTISLSGHSKDLVCFFDAATLDSLTEAYLTVADAPDVATWRGRLSSILAEVPKSIKLFHFFFEKKLSPPMQHLAYLFEPCLSFPNITAFEVELSTNTPHASDADLFKFAYAWPKLEFFSVQYEVIALQPRASIRTPRQVQPTLASLISFAQLCPSLFNLYLPAIDVTQVPSKDSVPLVRHSALRNLQFSKGLHRGATANLLDVAVIIDMLFPKIDTTRSVVLTEQTPSSIPRPPPSDNRATPWGLTRVLLAAMQARREQEEP
ncbi:hypothetical protein OH77DRAFT_1395521, partial [Trametes cingulata]